MELFPDLKDKRLYLRSVAIDENVVRELVDEGLSYFKKNSVGPPKFVFFLCMNSKYPSRNFYPLNFSENLSENSSIRLFSKLGDIS